MWRDYFHLLLKQKFIKFKANNPSLSMSAFSIKLGVGTGDLSELLSGKRKISSKRALKLSEKLSLTQNEADCLKMLVKKSVTLPRKTFIIDEVFLQQSDIYLLLMCLFDLDTKPLSDIEIAEKLNLSMEDLTSALDYLLANELIEKDGDSYRMTYAAMKTSEDIINPIHQNILLNELNRAKHLIKTLGPELRECTSITFPGSTDMLPEMKKEIRVFRDRMALIAAKSTKNEVYNLTINLLPLLNQKAEEPL